MIHSRTSQIRPSWDRGEVGKHNKSDIQRNKKTPFKYSKKSILDEKHAYKTDTAIKYVPSLKIVIAPSIVVPSTTIAIRARRGMSQAANHVITSSGVMSSAAIEFQAPNGG